MEQSAAVKNKKGSKILIIIIIAAVAAALLAGGWFFTGNLRTYMYGTGLLEAGNYEAAEAVFASLGDYRDSEERQEHAKYCKAEQLMEDRDYKEAVEIFEQLGEYKDSSEKMKQCCYSFARAKFASDNFDESYEYFIKAGDYEDAFDRAQKSMYAKGHAAFMEEDYRIAFECFEKIEGGEEEYGTPHFLTVSEAEEYLDAQREDLNRNISFYVAQELEGSKFELLNGSVMSADFMGVNIYEDIINYIPYYIGTAAYDEENKEVTLTIVSYYAGEKILDAYENGDTSALSDDEKAVLELALQLVEQAKAETDNDLELEIWLHDWICEKVTYESPDMNVSAIESLGLRQLSCIGAMLDGKANCQGYTDAFYLLGNLAGFEVDRVFGDAGEGHTWNTVNFDGKEYIVDLTFDDIDDEEYGGWTYTFFNAPWDSETYRIYGGKETVPLVTSEFSLENSWFSLNEGYFADENEAARHVIEGLKSNGKEWTHVVVEGKILDTDEFDRVINSVRGSFGNGKTWLYWIEHYNGNSYISVRFE